MAYTRQAGFSRLQHEQMVLGHVKHHGKIKRAEVMDLCHMDGNQAAKLLRRLKTEDKLIQHGKHKGSFYTLGEKEGL